MTRNLLLRLDHLWRSWRPSIVKESSPSTVSRTSTEHPPVILCLAGDQREAMSTKRYMYKLKFELTIVSQLIQCPVHLVCTYVCTYIRLVHVMYISSLFTHFLRILFNDIFYVLTHCVWNILLLIFRPIWSSLPMLSSLKAF